MNVIIDLCVVPLGVGLSVSKYVPSVMKSSRSRPVLRTACIRHQYRREWDQVFAVVKQCHERIHAMGAPRITTTIKAGTRIDREQTMAGKINSVKEKLA